MHGAAALSSLEKGIYEPFSQIGASQSATVKPPNSASIDMQDRAVVTAAALI